jgi:hypothetical protein
LLVAALVAVLAIFVLARIRFPDSDASPNPVTPLLDQLTPRARFADLASEIAALTPRVSARLQPIRIESDAGAPSPAAGRVVTAFRIRDDIGILLLPSGAGHLPSGVPLIGRSRGSGLSVIRLTSEAPVDPPASWTPDPLREPRYLMATAPGVGTISLRPMLVGALASTESVVWPGTLWRLPRRTDLEPGSFLFTPEGQLAGMAVDLDNAPAIVPADVLVAEAARLIAAGLTPPGYLGFEVVPLTASLSRATGVESGVVVSWVDRQGPARDALQIGDVIERADGAPLLNPDEWQARVDRLGPAEAVALVVRRANEARDVRVVGVAPPVAPPRTLLGLDLRRVPGGAEIVRIERHSAAEAARLQPGDIIVRISAVDAPSPAAVRRAFMSAAAGQPLLVAITRGESHHVLTLEKDAAVGR